MIAGSLIAGIAVYFVLSYLISPLRVTIPLAIITSILIYGLSRYYTDKNNNKDDADDYKSRNEANTIIKATKSNDSTVSSNLNDIELKQRPVLKQQREMDQGEKNNNINKKEGIIVKKNNNTISTIFANLLFVVGYATCLLIVTAYFFIFNPSNEEIFVPWEQFTIVQITELGASIALCFFLPGYALISILYRDPEHQINPLLKILLSYLLSILVTGLTGYIAVSGLGFGLLNTIGLFIVVYLSIFAVLLIQLLVTYNNQKIRSKYSVRNLFLKTHITEFVKYPVWNFLKRNSAEFTVFASLVALVLLSSYILNSGVILRDQWYYHGRSLSFMSGEYRDTSLSGADVTPLSPFPSALLAAFFSVSGIPSVNAYASISFLNVMPVFAFYYFFKNWVPISMKKAAILACTLFTLSSGFGWIYALDLAVANPPESQPSVMQMFYQAGTKSMDVLYPNSFLSGIHPDFSSPLVIMALPAGFTLLGLLGHPREEIINQNKFKFKYLAILLSITLLGILSHDEFYLFMIVASITPIFLFFTTKKRDEKKKNVVVVYAALLGALLLTLILATSSFAGAEIFVLNNVLGIPVLILCLVFVTITCILYIAIRFFNNLLYQKKYRNSQWYFQHSEGLLSSLLSRPFIKRFSGRRHRTIAPSLVLVFVIAWLYAFTFIVWNQVSVEAVGIQINEYVVPWYLYPMKLGVTGLLGLAFVLSYLFRKFEKEIFVFGIIVIIAFVAGPYYNEYRFSKYMMAGLAGFASLFIYNVIIQSSQIQKNNLFRILATSLVLGIVVFSSSLSVMAFWGYYAYLDDSGSGKHIVLYHLRDFPSASEFGLFNFLRNRDTDPLALNVAVPENETDFQLMGKVHAFSGIPWTKLTQSPTTQNANTLEGFYDLLNQSDTRYIILPKENFADLLTEQGKYKQIEIKDNGKQETDGQGQREGDATVEEGQRSAAITDILRFAVENFQKAYEDSKYLVLAVPSLTPPQSLADVGLVQKKSEHLAPSSADKDVIISLPYDREYFEGIGSPLVTTNEEKNVVIIRAIKEFSTVLLSDSRQQQRNANYFESTFRIVRQNNSEENYAGVVWNDTSMEYTLRLRNDTLEVEVQPADIGDSRNPNDEKSAHVRKIPRENGAWYTVKIIYMEETVNVYVNNILAVQIPRNDRLTSSEPYQRLTNSTINPDTDASITTNTAINKVGLFAFNNVAEFGPLRVGNINTGADTNQKTVLEHYYPLSMLALSKIKYDTFVDGDMSALSKKVVILNPNSLLSSLGSGANSTFSYEDYLKFVNDGGTLVIMNITDTDFFGKPILFGELFDIGNEVKFDSILYEAQRGLQNYEEKKEKGVKEARENPGRVVENEQGPQYLNVSGVAKDIVIRNTSAASDVSINSYYINSDNQKVAPFAIEKKYGMGRLIFLNNGGYFDAVARSPQQDFLTLAKTLKLSGLDPAVDRNYADNRTEKSRSGGVTPIVRVVGDLRIDGKTNVTSSSFSLVPDNNNAYRGSYDSYMNDDFYVQSVMYSTPDYKSITWNSSNSSPKSYDFEKENGGNNDTLIEGLRLSGPYEVIASLNGSLVLPSRLESYYNYIGTSIPTGSDIVLKLHNGSTAEFVASNDTGQKLFKLSDDGEILFHNVRQSGNGTNISVLLKSPEIRVANGKINFENLNNIDYSYVPRLTSNSTCEYMTSHMDCRQLEVNGKMVGTLDHVDFNQGTESDTVSYINSLEFEQDKIDGEEQKMGLDLELPADISRDAKERGITVPWQKVLFSDTGVAVFISMFVYDVVIVIFIITSRRHQPKRTTD